MIRRINDLIARKKAMSQQESITRQVIRYIRKLRIDTLLVCPQTIVDLQVGVEVMKRTGLPTVVWFMDNYYTDQSAMSYVKEMWDKSSRRFVISEPMKHFFSESYGGDCEVLNNSVTFPEYYTEPIHKADTRLRVAYAGAMHSYYADSMSMVLKELQGLDEQVVCDIYSHENLPPCDEAKDRSACRWFPALAAGDLIKRLQDYDVLLLLSSFKLKHKALAETSQASKVADYLAAGRCILVYGPSYAQNVRYAQQYGFGEAVTSQAPGSLRTAILSLARNPERRYELGKRAYNFGMERHNKATNRARLWQSLFHVLESSGNHVRRENSSK